MYIISKHKDYYDSAIGIAGIDKSLVFERKKESFDLKSGLKKSKFTNPFHFNDHDDIHVFLVGFCGKTYIVCQKGTKVQQSWNSTYEETEYEFIYDLEKIKKLIGYYKTYTKYTNGDKERFDSLVEMYHEKDSELFHKYKTPYFIIRTPTYHQYSYSIDINPILKEVEFYKRFDSFTAYQEISMFLGGVLTVGISDGYEPTNQTRIDNHGYDKWSFRNPDPPKRKRKKKKV